MAAENRRVFMVTKKCRSDPDGFWKAAMPGDPDLASTNRFTSPLRESTDRFTSPRKESRERFTSPLRESTDRFTVPLEDTSDRFTTPLRKTTDKNRGRNSSKFKSKKRDSWEASNPPPSRDRSPHKYNDKFRSTTGRNEAEPEKRSHPTDNYQRNEPPPKDTQLFPSRNSYDHFRDDDDDDKRHNSYNSTYDRNDYNNQQTCHEESSYSNPDVIKRPFLDATILITTSQLRNYAERIERRLKNLNMATEIRNMPDSLLQNQVIEDIARQGVLYVIIVNSQNEAHHSLTLHIFQGTPQEHRNMPSDDAMSLVARNFERYLQVLKEKNTGHASTAAPYTSSSSQSMAPPQTASTPSSHPPSNPVLSSPHQQGLPFLPPSAEISYLLNLLADCRHLTLQELDKVLDYLQERKRELLEIPQPKTSKGAGDFSSGDDLQRMEKNRLMSPVPPKTDFQSKILSMIMPSNMSDKMNSNMNNSLQQSTHNLPVQPIRSGDMITQNDQSLQSISANTSSNMTALINFDNPTVQKALDNLIQSGPSLLQNINAVSKSTNPQHLSTNPSLDRNQGSYNTYGLPQSVDRAGPQMMSHMGGGGSSSSSSLGNIHPNMSMNTGMNMDQISHVPHFNRGSNMFQNGPQMMGRERPGPISGLHTDIHPQQY